LPVGVRDHRGGDRRDVRVARLHAGGGVSVPECASRFDWDAADWFSMRVNGQPFHRGLFTEGQPTFTRYQHGEPWHWTVPVLEAEGIASTGWEALHDAQAVGIRMGYGS